METRLKTSRAAPKGVTKGSPQPLISAGRRRHGPSHNGRADKCTHPAPELLPSWLMLLESETRFPLEGTQQEPASSAGHAGHCPQTVPGTATKNRHSHWDLPGPACPSLANLLPGTALCRDLLPACSSSAPSPAPTGTFPDHPSMLPWGWSHASTIHHMSNTRGAGSLPPSYNSISMESGSKACSARGEDRLYLHHFARKHPTSAQALL